MALISSSTCSKEITYSRSLSHQQRHRQHHSCDNEICILGSISKKRKIGWRKTQKKKEIVKFIKNCQSLFFVTFDPNFLLHSSSFLRFTEWCFSIIIIALLSDFSLNFPCFLHFRWFLFTLKKIFLLSKIDYFAIFLLNDNSKTFKFIWFSMMIYLINLRVVEKYNPQYFMRRFFGVFSREGKQSFSEILNSKQHLFTKSINHLLLEY